MKEKDAVLTLWNKTSGLIDEKLSHAYYDKTFPSVIYGKNGDGTYKIVREGVTYDVPNSLGIELQKGQSVWITMPCGTKKLKDMYISGVRDGYEITSSSGGSGEVISAIQSDWTITDENSLAYIKNKPTIPTKTSELENDSEFATADNLSAMHSTSRLFINRTGWYRIAEYVTSAEASAQGLNSNSCTFIIKSSKGYCKVSLMSKKDAQVFKVLESIGTLLVTKVRYTYIDNIAYIEAYCDHSSLSGSSGDNYHIIVSDGSDFLFKWEAIKPVQTWEEEEGVTVTATCDVTKNVNITTNLDLRRFSGMYSGNQLKTSILDKALEVDSGFHSFILSPSYEGGDLPDDGYGYGMAAIFKHSSANNTVILWGSGKNDGSNKIAINYFAQWEWSGWKTNVTTEELEEVISNFETRLDDKVDKVEGKGLSTNDFTDEYKNKIDSITGGGGTGVQSDWSVTDESSLAYIKNKPTTLEGFGITDAVSDSELESAVEELQGELDSKVSVTTKVNGKELSSDITLFASDVGADASGSASSALTEAKGYTDTALETAKSYTDSTATTTLDSAKSYADTVSAEALADAKEYNDAAYANANAYTDEKIADLINGAPTTLDTLKEIADAMSENEEVVDALEEAIGTKANQSELDTHTGNSTIHVTSTDKSNWNDANSKKHTHSNKTVLDSITAIDTALSDTSTNPVQNKTIKEAFDGVQSTTKATLSTAGWYRVAEYVGSNTNAPLGDRANSCYLTIKQANTNSGNESHVLLLSSIKSSQYIKSVYSKTMGSSNRTITKARYTSIDKTAYLEVYYASGTTNRVFFAVSSSMDADNTWKAITPTLTSETVDGVTVTATYDIPANASPVTDLDLEALSAELGHKFNIVSEVADMNTVPAYTAGIVYSTASNVPSSFTAGYGLFYTIGWGNSYQIQRIVTDSVTYERSINNNVYAEWKQTATTADLAKYLPLTGGMINGGINFRFADNGQGSLFKNNSTTADYGTVLRDVTADNKTVAIQLSASRNTLQFADSNGTANSILHAGNYSDYALPKTGGELSGNLTVKKASATEAKVAVENANRRLTFELNSNGDGYIWDGTLGKAIASFSVGGTYTWNGYASGNLPLTGGTTSGDIEVKGASASRFKATSSDGKYNMSLVATNDGYTGLYDTINGAWLVQHKPDGTNTFNGNATSATTLSGLTASVSELNYTDGVTSNIQTQLDGKVTSIPNGAVTPSQDAESYFKICTVQLPNQYADLYLEFDLSGRTIYRFQKVKCVVCKSASTAISNVALYTSGNNGNAYKVHAYKYVDSTKGDYLEIWCTITSWDNLHIRLNQLTGNFSDFASYVTWDYERATALPTTSTSIVKVDATNEKWSGEATSATTATTATKLSNTSTIGSATNPVYFNASGVPVATTYTLGASVPSGAVFTDTKVKISAVAPTTKTKYYPAMHTATSGTTTVSASADVAFSVLNGTTSEEGLARLILGNGTAKGTANNSSGKILMYSGSSGYHTFGVADTTSAPVHTFPATTGTILNTGTTSFTQTLTSGTEIGSIKINGSSTKLYAPTNTDVNVKQTSSSTSNYRALLMGTSHNADASALNTEETGQVYKNTSIVACPSTGEIKATKFTGALNGNATTATSLSSTLAVAKGGTGATTASAARANLGAKAAEPTTFTLQDKYVGVRTAGRTASQYYEFWDTDAGWADIHAGKITSQGGFTGDLTGNASSATTLKNLTATVTELNYCDGVTSNIQTQLNGKAASSHGTHVSYGTSASALGTSSAGSASTVSRSDHVHALPALTSCTGTLTVAKGGTGATDAATARTNLGLGTAATYAATTSISSGGTGLITSGAVYTALAGKAASSHNQAASTITAGTFGGAVVAPASTAYTTNQIRNTVFTTTDPGAGATTSYANGSIICVYE